MNRTYSNGRPSRCVLAGLLALTTAAPLLAADWPQFLGPERTGIAPDKGLLRAWPEGGPKTLWTIDLGPGFGGPAIADGKVYLMDRMGDKNQAKDALRCLDLATGKEEWNLTYEAPGKMEYNGSRGTPAVDAKHIFAIGAVGNFTCVDKATHLAVWSKHLLKDFGTKPQDYGVAQSPVLYQDLVIVAPQTKTVGLVAYKRDTGQEAWRSPPTGPMSHVTPALANIGGVDQFVMIGQNSTISGVAAASGELLWSFKSKNWTNDTPIPSATPIGDGRFFITGGYKCGSMMIKVAKNGDKFAASEVFNIPKHGAIIHNALLHKDHLYVNCTTKSEFDGLMCFDLDGNIKWETGRSPNFEKGAILIADDLLLALDGKTGALALAQAAPDGYKELARAKVLDGKGGDIWAPMALSDGKLLVRDQKQMKCLLLK
jgi:outer membrane protein assembly factor BamB